ncbi:hypothetical protein [Roseibacillus persicicus]|uniref:hypothetical protein n=1 Tax=Roseibacillus persicicus TaxID=454148 RepID=UPI00280FF359|nr:hypothetical protein [Roseibacillus persicicus]MDQ8190225.1 hypothetical protein [Roseibacillus persicicus]
MNPLENTPVPERLASLAQPSLDSLLQFATSCSEDPNTRTLAVTSLVLSFWQLAGARTIGTLPSFFFVGNSQKNQSPIAKLVFGILKQESDSTPREQQDGLFKHGKIKDAPSRMATSIHRHQHLLRTASIQSSRQACQRYHDEFYAAQKTAYGYGRSRPYADSWSKHFGLISEADGIVALRIERTEDVKLLKEHLLENKTLLPPKGIGEHLAFTAKRIALTGSLTTGQWDFGSACKLLELGLPILMLPHHKTQPFDFSNWEPIKFLAMVWPKFELSRVSPTSWLAGTEQNKQCYHHLRQRLSHLPSDYEFAIHTLVRELLSLCCNLGSLAGRHSPKESHSKAGDLVCKLHDETLRGITLGVESLIWHGLGLPISHPPELIAKTLQLLREKGPHSLRDLQRAARLPNATTRDEILTALEEAGVVRIQDKTVTAITFSEFTAGVYARLQSTSVLSPLIKNSPSKH